MTDTPAGVIAEWRCPYCGELNDAAIHRCNSCHQLRLPDVEQVQIPSGGAASIAEARDLERIRSASPLRAAGLYLTWLRMPRRYARVAGSFAIVALLILIAGAPAQTADRHWSMAISGFVLGIMFGLLVPAQARGHRSDWPFLLALGLLSFAMFAAAYAVAGAIAAVLPRPGSESIVAALVHAIDPTVDAESGVLVLVVVMFAAAVVVALLGRMAYGRQRAPNIGQ
jgi:hypothetical protein